MAEASRPPPVAVNCSALPQHLLGRDWVWGECFISVQRNCVSFFLDCHPDLSTQEEAASSCCRALAGVRCSFSQKAVAAAAARISCDMPQAFSRTMVGTVTPLTCGFPSSGPPPRPLVCSVAPARCCQRILSSYLLQAAKKSELCPWVTPKCGCPLLGTVCAPGFSAGIPLSLINQVAVPLGTECVIWGPLGDLRLGPAWLVGQRCV